MVVDISRLASEDILTTLNVPNCPTMLVGPSRVGDRGEKGDVVGCIDRLLGVDDGSVVSIGVGGVNWSDEVKGHLAMVHIVSFFAEEWMFQGVGMGDVDSGSWGELVVFKGGVDGGVAVDECPEAGRGHDRGESSS